jgi:hypothetical protein
MRINFSRLTTDTLAELAKRVLGTSAKATYVVVLNHPLLLVLQSVFDKYFAVFDRKAYSGKGKLVGAADLLRDNYFKGILKSLLGLTQMEGLVAHQDALDLYDIFETHGLDLYRYSYGDQSTHMDKLIADLDKPENQIKLERVHLTEAYNLMKAAHQNFEVNFGDQTEANAQLHQMESASSLRGSLEVALRNYFNTVESMKDVVGWQDLYGEINEHVKAAKNSSQSAKDTDIPPSAPAK